MPIYMQYEGIPGESTSPSHHNWIDIMSLSWGESNTGAVAGGGGGGAGKVVFQDMSIAKVNDKSSPKLFLACANGRHARRVVVEFTREFQEREETYLKFELTDCIVTSYQVAGDGGSAPMDQVSFNFAKMEYSYIPYNNEGVPEPPIMHWWDVKTNRGG
jgi:type VI secretion system secreted protein Hcp